MSGSSSLRNGGGVSSLVNQLQSKTRRRKESSTSDHLGDLESAGINKRDKIRGNNSTFDFDIGDVNSSSN